MSFNEKSEKKPSFKLVVMTDIGVFTIISFPAVMYILSILYSLANYRELSSYSFTEYVYVALLVLLSLVVYFLGAYWWYKVIAKTFKLGNEIKATITNSFHVKGLYIGIYYSFEYEGKRYNHSQTILSNRRTKKILSQSKLTAVFNPKKKISFIKDAFLDV